MTRNPNFPAEEVEREKKKHLDALAQAESSPDQIARRMGAMLAFGRDHAYGHPVQGFRSSIENIKPQDLIRFHATYWKPGSSALVFVGDISLDQALAMSKQYFGSWAGGAAPSATIPPPNPLARGKIYLVNRRDAAQTVIAEVLSGPTRNVAEYYSFALADAVWGGAVGARLGMNLREEKGYSYSVVSRPSFYSKSGVWIAQGGVQTDKTKESIIEFQKELRFIAGEKPVSANELATAKSFRIRGYAQQFESLRRVSDQITQLWSLGLPISDLQREPAELEKVTLASVNATAEKYATPSHATLLLVGDASKIEPGVRDLKLGEVVTLDVEGRPANDKTK